MDDCCGLGRRQLLRLSAAGAGAAAVAPWLLATRATSSGEYLGLYPAYTLGMTADRNHVVTRDFRALR
jgi:hypothetical protein